MLYIVPYRSTAKGPIFPWMNHLLLASLVLIYAWIRLLGGEQYLNRLILSQKELFSVFGYMWVHANLLHLLLNLFYLWVFGNALCSKIGNALYGLFFVLGGILAGTGYLLFDGRPCVGASGAINAVIVALCILYPYQHVYGCLLLVIVPISRFSLMGIWFVGIKFLYELLFSFIGIGQVAYIAHVSGIVGGGVLSVLLLKLKLVKSEHTNRDLVQAIYATTK